MKKVSLLFVILALLASACTPANPMDDYAAADFYDVASATYPEVSKDAAPVVISIQYVSDTQIETVIEFPSPLSGKFGALAGEQRAACGIDTRNDRQLLCISPDLPSGSITSLKVYALGDKPTLVFKNPITIPAKPPKTTKIPIYYFTRTPTPGVYPPPNTATATVTRTPIPYPLPATPTRTATAGPYPPPRSPTPTPTVTRTTAPYPPPPTSTPTATAGIYPPPPTRTPTTTKNPLPTAKVTATPTNSSYP